MLNRKKVQTLAKQFFELSLVDGKLDGSRVAGVLAYIEKHQTTSPLVILKAYQRIVAREVAKGVAQVEHAGAISERALAAIEGAMSQRYNRPVTANAEANPSLLAGVRVRVGDDVFESSVSGQLDALSASV